MNLEDYDKIQCSAKGFDELRAEGVKICDLPTDILRTYNHKKWPHRQTGEYHSYIQMKNRCLNPKVPQYAYYGARGITICEEWKSSFAWFVLDMGEKPTPQHTLDRIDNSKGYYRENCRWATKRDQSLNRSQTRWIEYDGQTMCARDWSRKLGGPNSLVSGRLKVGWSIEEAVTIPPYSKRKDFARAIVKILEEEKS